MKEKSYRYPWQETYIQRLGLIRENLIRDPKLNEALPAFVFPETLTILDNWRDNNEVPITINVVVVSPNSGTPTFRVLTYLHEALRVAETLRKLKLQVDSLRIINPCHLNVLCNGGNLKYQERGGIVLAGNLNRWIEKYFPKLQTNFKIVLDQGAAINEDSLPQLIQSARRFASALDSNIFQQFVEKWEKHRYDDGQGITNLDPEDATSLYLLAHPIAWQYIDENLLLSLGFSPRLLSSFGFRPRSGRVLNCMPQSEFPFAGAMKSAGVPVEPGPDQECVATAFSLTHISAPYYPFLEDEPLLPRRWSLKVNANYLQTLMTDWRKLSGNHHVAEMLDCFGPLRAFLQEKRR